MNRIVSLVCLGLLTFSTSGCGEQEVELRSSKYNDEALSMLKNLPCDEYRAVAVCETWAFAHNVGHMRDTTFEKTARDKGQISVHGTIVFWEPLRRTVYLRCDVESYVKRAIEVNNELGVLGRTATGMVGRDVVDCKYVKTLRDIL